VDSDGVDDLDVRAEVAQHGTIEVLGPGLDSGPANDGASSVCCRATTEF
jgi:hypothetical protein